MSLHPSAIIHPKAQLGSRVTIGPFAVIEGAAQIGDDCHIQAHAIIGAHVVMGKNNRVGYGAILGADPQDFAFSPEVTSTVRIGDNNRIREYTTIHRGSSAGSETVVGNDCFLMAGCHLAHNVHLGDHVVIANNALLGGHVIIQDRVFIGGACVFHQHIRVGQLAICQGTSGYSKDVPPFTIGAERNGIAGLNIVGLRRAGLSPAERTEVKRAFSAIYRQGLNVSQALRAVEKEHWGPHASAFFEFIAAAKKRGICDLIATRTRAVTAEEENPM